MRNSLSFELRGGRMATRATACALVSFLFGACTGTIGMENHPERGEPDDTSGQGPAGNTGLDGNGGADGSETDGRNAACKTGVVAVGADRLLRLTRSKYNNTVRDLLGDSTAPANAFPGDESDPGSGFVVNNTFVVGRSHVESFQSAAETLAAAAVAKMKSILPCDPGVVGESTCADSFIAAFGRRAFRRPLTPDERKDVRKLYDAGGSFTDGIRLVIQGMLQTPDFLYRLEGGTSDTGSARRLDGNEVATRLSYFLWDTMPDDELWKAADDGLLATSDGIASQARRLLQSSRAKDAIVDLYTQWLEMNGLSTLTKDTTAYSAFTPALRDSMRLETENFVDYVIRQGDGALTTLLGATKPWTFADAGLAKLYGVDLVKDRITLTPAPSLPAGFVPVALDPGARAGLLTQASVLATHGKPDRSDPVGRGRLLRKRLLCQDLPPPPPNVPEVEAPTEARTLRDQLAAHRDNPACSGCHDLLDPLGLGLEQYDGIGQFSTTDGFGRTIDARGEISGTDVDGEFEGGVELTNKLSGSETVRECMARSWFRYALSRTDTKDDECTIADLTAELRSSDSVRDVIFGLVSSDAFRFRLAEEGQP